MMTLRIHDTGGEAMARLIVSWLMIHSWAGWSGWDAGRRLEFQTDNRRNVWLSPHSLFDRSRSPICQNICPGMQTIVLSFVHQQFRFLFADDVVSHVSPAISLSCQVIIWQRRVPFEASEAVTVRTEREEPCNLQWNEIVLLSDNASGVSCAGHDWRVISD